MRFFLDPKSWGAGEAGGLGGGRREWHDGVFSTLLLFLKRQTNKGAADAWSLSISFATSSYASCRNSRPVSKINSVIRALLRKPGGLGCNSSGHDLKYMRPPGKWT